MGERNIAAEVLRGLREIREHRAGERALHTIRVQAKPLADLTPGMIARIRRESRREHVRGVRRPAAAEFWKSCSAQNGMFDIEGFTKRLRDLDAIRRDDQLQSGIVERIGPNTQKSGRPNSKRTYEMRWLQPVRRARTGIRPKRSPGRCVATMSFSSRRTAMQDHGPRCADAA